MLTSNSDWTVLRRNCIAFKLNLGPFISCCGNKSESIPFVDLTNSMFADQNTNKDKFLKYWQTFHPLSGNKSDLVTEIKGTGTEISSW